jgi:hypothetical protein
MRPSGKFMKGQHLNVSDYASARTMATLDAFQVQPPIPLGEFQTNFDWTCNVVVMGKVADTVITNQVSIYDGQQRFQPPEISEPGYVTYFVPFWALPASCPGACCCARLCY